MEVKISGIAPCMIRRTFTVTERIDMAKKTEQQKIIDRIIRTLQPFGRKRRERILNVVTMTLDTSDDLEDDEDDEDEREPQEDTEESASDLEETTPDMEESPKERKNRLAREKRAKEKKS